MLILANTDQLIPIRTVAIQSQLNPILSKYSRVQSQSVDYIPNTVDSSPNSVVYSSNTVSIVKLLWDCIRLDCIGLYSDCIAAVLGLYCDCTYWSALARINLHWDCIGLYLSDVSVLYCFGNVAPSPAALFK